MRQFTIAAATLAIAGLISAAPAVADHLAGGSPKQNGQCWRSHQPPSDARFGTWVACPQPAAAPAAQRATRRRI
jgi:hypothetical protein